MKRLAIFEGAALFYLLLGCAGQVMAAPPAGSAAFVPLPHAGALNKEMQQELPGLPEQKLSTAPFSIPVDGRTPQRGGDDLRVVVRSVALDTGIIPSKIHHAAVQARLASFLNRPIAFAGLQEMAAVVTAYYQDQGYVVAKAILPPQKITGGRLSIRVVEGRWDEPSLTNQGVLKAEFAQKMVRAGICRTACDTSVATRGDVEREVLLLNELPGVSADVSLVSGQKPETTRLKVALKKAEKPYGGYVSVDNQGSPYSGSNRALGGLYLNNLTGYADQLNASFMLSDTTDMLTGTVDYSILVGYYGTRVGARYSYLDYNLKGPFSALDARGNYSEWRGYVTHPVVRAADARMNLRLDIFDQQTQDLRKQTEADKRIIRGATLGADGVYAWVPGGLTSVSLSTTAGDTDLRSDAVRMFDEKTVGIGGSFTRLNAGLSHEQAIIPRLAFYNRIDGQLASGNLDGSQKMLLGGPGAVRAYGIGEGSADTGLVYTAELRTNWHPTIPMLSSQGHGLTAAAFFDQGLGSYYKSVPGSLSDNNRMNLSGVGTYVALGRDADYSVRLTWAHRTGQSVGSGSGADRWWVTAYKAF